MIYIIDYGFENLYELFHDDYATYELKIESTEFSLKPNLTVTMNSIPSEIFKKRAADSQLSHYENSSGDKLTIDEYKIQRQTLRIKDQHGSYDDDGNFIFFTREDKRNHDEFVANWNSVYTDPKLEWHAVDFQVIAKQFIMPEHRDFIESQIVIHTAQSAVQSICVYRPNFEMMFRNIANKHMFTEIPDQNRQETTGKKYSVHTGIKYTKCNNEYVTRYFDNKGLFSPWKGTYQDCITAFNRDYTAIEQYILMVSNDIDAKPINILTVKRLLEIVFDVKNKVNLVDSMKSTRDNYRSLIKLINDLEQILLQNLQ